MKELLHSIATNQVLQERIAYGAFVLCLLILERWFGKTGKVKAGSLLEAVENVTIKKLTKQKE